MSSIATTVSTPVTKTTKSKTTPSAPKKSKKNESVSAPQELDDVKEKLDFGSDNETTTTQTVQTVEEVKPEPKKRGRKSNAEKVAENKTTTSDSETTQVVEDKKPEPKKRGRKSNAEKVLTAEKANEETTEDNTSADSSEETNDIGLKTIEEVKFALNIIQLKTKSIQGFMIKGNKKSKTNKIPYLQLNIISNGVNVLYEYIQNHLSSTSVNETQIEEISSTEDVNLSLSVMLEKTALISKYISKSVPKVHRLQLRLLINMTIDALHLFEEYLNAPIVTKNVKKEKKSKERNLPRLELNPQFLDFLKTYEVKDEDGNVSNTLIEKALKNPKFATSYANHDSENPYLLKQPEVQIIISRIFQDMKEKNDTKTTSFPIQNDANADALITVYNNIIAEEVNKGESSYFKENIANLRSTTNSKGKSCDVKLTESNTIPNVISNTWLTCYNPFLFVRNSMPKQKKVKNVNSEVEDSEQESEEDEE